MEFEPKKFVDSADVVTTEFEYQVYNGYSTVVLPASPPGDVAFIAAVVIKDDPAYKMLRLMEPTNAVYTQLRAETLRALSPEGELVIPCTIDDSGLGALPNLSHACAYRLDVECEGNVLVKGELLGYTLPEREDGLGRPQMCTPPYAGSAQFWNEIYNCQVGKDGGFQINRVGNYIRGFGIRSDVFPEHPVFRWDETYPEQVAGDQIKKTMKGDLHWYSFDPWLPTVTYSYISIEGLHAAGTFDYVVNDIAVPIPMVPARRRRRF